MCSSDLGDVVNGEIYALPENIAALEEYHASALIAHKEHRKPDIALPVF